MHKTEISRKKYFMLFYKYVQNNSRLSQGHDKVECLKNT